MFPQHLTRYDGFLIALPEGWCELAEEASFSNPAEGTRLAFSRPGGPSTLYVSLLPSDPDDFAIETPEDLEHLAHAWGHARGLMAPLALVSGHRDDHFVACATYKLAAEFIEVLFLAHAGEVLCASYVCPWNALEEEVDTRRRLVSSIRIAA